MLFSRAHYLIHKPPHLHRTQRECENLRHAVFLCGLLLKVLLDAADGSSGRVLHLQLSYTSALYIDLIPQLVTQINLAWLLGSEDHRFNWTRTGSGLFGF